MNTKVCRKCKESKSLTDFYKAKYKYESDGYDYYCKYCRIGTSIKSQRDKAKPCSIEICDRPHYAKGWCRNHYERMRRTDGLESCYEVVEDEKVYLYGKKRITYKRAYHLMYKYQLTVERYDEMKALGCHVCGEYQERNLHVDHDHNCCSEHVTCGKCVRGVLCNKCNTAVGKYDQGKIRQDHPMLDKIIRYVEEYNGKTKEA